MKDSLDKSIQLRTGLLFETGVYNMSVKIKISYTTDEELEEVTRPLSSLVKSWKKQPAKGKYKRAYGILSHERSPNEAREGANS